MLGRLEYWKRSIGGLLVLVDTTGLVQPFPDDSFFCLLFFFCGDDDRLLATTLHIRIGVYEVSTPTNYVVVIINRLIKHTHQQPTTNNTK